MGFGVIRRKVSYAAGMMALTRIRALGSRV